MTDPPNERQTVNLALDNLRRETDYRFETVNQRFMAAESAVAAALAAAKEAVIKAELANEKQFGAMNEKIDTLIASMNTIEGNAVGVTTTVARSIAIGTLVLSLIVFLVNYGFSR